MENYETIGVLGEGTYGVVIKARHRTTGQLVAIKKFKQAEDDEHVRKTSLREVKVLKQLHHPNVVGLVEVFRRDGKLYLVFEYIEHTILQLLEATTHGLKPLEVKKFMYQLLRGVDYCHAHSIIHRDVKPENILVSQDGLLKVCDFGFARHMTAKGKYTDYVATRWYRPPELLVGDVAYGRGVDVWAIGCILAELSDSQPLFPGDSDLDQLALILRTCGPVPERMVKIFELNPLYRRVPFPHPSKGVHRTLQQRYPRQSPEWMEFLTACLRTNPEERPSCAELMNLAYFTKDNFRVDYERELQQLAATAAPWLYDTGGSNSGSAPAPAPSPPLRLPSESRDSPRGGAANGTDRPSPPAAAAQTPATTTTTTTTGKKRPLESPTSTPPPPPGPPSLLPDISGSSLIAPSVVSHTVGGGGAAVPGAVGMSTTNTRREEREAAERASNATAAPMAMSGKGCFTPSPGAGGAGPSRGDGADALLTASFAAHGSTNSGGGAPLPHLGVLWSQYLGVGGGGGGAGSTASGSTTPALPLLYPTGQGGAPAPVELSHHPRGSVLAAGGPGSDGVGGGGGNVGAAFASGPRKSKWLVETCGSTGGGGAQAPAPLVMAAMTVPAPHALAGGRQPSLSGAVAPAEAPSPRPSTDRARSRDDGGGSDGSSSGVTPTRKAKAAGQPGGRGREGVAQGKQDTTTRDPSPQARPLMDSGECDGITSPSAPSTPSPREGVGAPGVDEAPARTVQLAAGGTLPPQAVAGASESSQRARQSPSFLPRRDSSARRAAAALQALADFRSNVTAVTLGAGGPGAHDAEANSGHSTVPPAARSPSPQSQSTALSTPRRAAPLPKRRSVRAGEGPSGMTIRKPIAIRQRKRRQEGAGAGEGGGQGLVGSTQAGARAGGAGASSLAPTQSRPSNPLRPAQPPSRPAVGSSTLATTASRPDDGGGGTGGGYANGGNRRPSENVGGAVAKAGASGAPSGALGLGYTVFGRGSNAKREGTYAFAKQSRKPGNTGGTLTSLNAGTGEGPSGGTGETTGATYAYVKQTHGLRHFSTSTGLGGAHPTGSVSGGAGGGNARAGNGNGNHAVSSKEGGAGHPVDEPAIARETLPQLNIGRS